MLTPAETVKVFQDQPEQCFVQGDVIFQEGQSGDVMYGILEGEVELSVQGKGILTLGSGDIFGIRALIYEAAIRDSTAIAKTDCKLAHLNRERFYFAVQETPMFALNVMRSYAERVVQLEQLV